MKPKYENEPIVNGRWTKWIFPPRRGHKLACCDCGLVHDMQFRLVPAGRGYSIEYRAARNYEDTAMLRKRDRRK